MEKDYLIDKWLNEGLTDEEMNYFRQREDSEELMAIIENAKLFKASNFSEVADFDTFHAKLRREKKSPNKLSWVKPLLRVAAVLVAGVALFYFLFNDDTVQIKTLAGEKRQLELPDASTVVVNALSTISYESDSWNENRVIELEGEAFFDVTKGSSFDVNTSAGTVTVLGTEFNVKQRDGFFEVKCFEGSVQVLTAAQNEILEQGEHFRLLGDQVVLGKNIYEEPQWTQNISSFQGVPFLVVIEELERQYDIDVKFQNVQSNALFTGGFVHDDLENALISITEPLHLNFKLERTNQVSIYPREK